MHAAQNEAEQHTAATAAALGLDAFANETSGATITVAVASNRQALHASWRPLLAHATDIQIGDAVMDAAHLLTCMKRHLPDIVLIDKVFLDELDPSSLKQITEQRPNPRVLLLGDEICPGLVADVLRYRFHGLLPTTCLPEVGLKAIRAVSNGELWLSRASLASVITDLLGLSDLERVKASADLLSLSASEALTPREAQVVELLRRGCINKEIARELGIMEDTVKKHLHSVFAKLGVHRRAHVALRGLPGHGVAQSIPHTHRMQTRGAIETGN